MRDVGKTPETATLKVGSAYLYGNEDGTILVSTSAGEAVIPSTILNELLEAVVQIYSLPIRDESLVDISPVIYDAPK